VTYTTANDHSSYETCDTNFQGNSWVGTVACKDKPNSKCTAAVNTAMIEGHSSCPCVLPAKAQTAATGKPSYVTGAPNQKVPHPYAYGYGIKAHNLGKPECLTDLADGEKNDWCQDKWCIVDPNNCAMKIRPVGYTADRGDYFSYETANRNFNGNSWTGKLKCLDFPNSHCTADVNTAMAGNPDCPCVLPAKMQTAATGKPAYVTDSPYGYGCQAFDQYKDACASNPADWCADKWCVVDPNNCVFKAREVTYTTASDHSSYETCDTNFQGNSWVGTVACKDKPNSHCTAADNTAMTGNPLCPCVLPAKAQTAAAGEPSYVNGAPRQKDLHPYAYGYGIMAHNLGKPECQTFLADGEKNDWCKDEWCIVDPNNCAMKIRPVEYTVDRGDYFSYETANPNFDGNSWTGTMKCLDFVNSHCTAGVNTAMAGNPDCPCVLPAKMQTAATGKPAYVTNSPYGYGCQAFDQFKHDCSGANPADWCADQWCVVDPNKCVFKARELTYTVANDHSSYETCDANFKGNSWVGTMACSENSNSFCMSDNNSTDGTSQLAMSGAITVMLLFSASV